MVKHRRLAGVWPSSPKAPACLNAAAHLGGILFSRRLSPVPPAVIQPQRREDGAAAAAASRSASGAGGGEFPILEAVVEKARANGYEISNLDHANMIAMLRETGHEHEPSIAERLGFVR